MAEMSFDLGERLRTVRKERGLSQRELAKKTGVTNGTISLIEKNKISPSVASLKRILDGFPMTLSGFFGYDSLPEEQIFFSENVLIDLVRNGISNRQVGANIEGRMLQISHERYGPGADSGVEMLRQLPKREASSSAVSSRLASAVRSECWRLAMRIASAVDCPIDFATSMQRSAKSSAP